MMLSVSKVKCCSTALCWNGHTETRIWINLKTEQFSPWAATLDIWSRSTYLVTREAETSLASSELSLPNWNPANKMTADTVVSFWSGQVWQDAGPHSCSYLTLSVQTPHPLISHTNNPRTHYTSHIEGWEPERHKWHFTNFTGEPKQKFYHSLI